MYSILKNLLHLGGWSALALYLIISMGAVESKMDNRAVNGLDVEVVNSKQSNFVAADDIRKMLENKGWKFDGDDVDSISTEKIEMQLKTHPWLQNAECYRTVDNTVKVNVWQRKPVARVMADHQNYYLDKDGHQMPPGVFSAAHVPVITGHRTDSLLRSDIIRMVDTINDDKFLNAQIQQLHINDSKEFVLIPRAGKHEILFGAASNIDNKFYKLKKLYKEEFGQNGWNRYRVIDLRFDNQVVCTKK